MHAEIIILACIGSFDINELESLPSLENNTPSNLSVSFFRTKLTAANVPLLEKKLFL